MQFMQIKLKDTNAINIVIILQLQTDSKFKNKRTIKGRGNGITT